MVAALNVLDNERSTTNRGRVLGQTTTPYQLQIKIVTLHRENEL